MDNVGQIGVGRYGLLRFEFRDLRVDELDAFVNRRGDSDVTVSNEVDVAYLEDLDRGVVPSWKGQRDLSHAFPLLCCPGPERPVELGGFVD